MLEKRNVENRVDFHQIGELHSTRRNNGDLPFLVFGSENLRDIVRSHESWHEFKLSGRLKLDVRRRKHNRIAQDKFYIPSLFIGVCFLSLLRYLH